MSKIVWQKDGVRIIEDNVGNYGLEFRTGQDLMDFDQWKFKEMLQGWELNLIKDYIREQSKARA